MTAPLSLIVSAFAPVTDVRRALTPELLAGGDTTQELLLVDLGRGKNRLGGSALAQVYGQLGATPPDLDDPALLRGFFAAVQELGAAGIAARVPRPHRRRPVRDAAGDGVRGRRRPGHRARRRWATTRSRRCSPRSWARWSRCATPTSRARRRCSPATACGACTRRLGRAKRDDRIILRRDGRTVFEERRSILRGIWSETTHAMQSLRDDPTCADEEQAARVDADDPGLSVVATLRPRRRRRRAAASPRGGARPRVAILREQGVNGQIEMAAAFDRAGFEAVDVHMSDLLGGRRDLADFRGLAACGGFSYGDVLGAGEGWAKSILFNAARARRCSPSFFARQDTFALGVCNGCQMMSALKELIPGAGAWPRFVRNRSEQFEARLSLVTVEPTARRCCCAGWPARGCRSPSPTAKAAPSGRPTTGAARWSELGLVAARFVDHRGRADRALPRQPQRLARRHHRADHTATAA